MIIAAIATVDDYDGVSIRTLVTPDHTKLPRFFAGLTYASLIISLFPFAFSLINIVTTRLFSILTMLAYVLTTPFHFGAFLIIWQYKRQIDMQLPFGVSSRRTMVYLSFLMPLWLLSATMSGMGGHRFMKQGICWDDGKNMIVSCSHHKFAKVTFAFVGATLFSVIEFFITLALLVVCFRSRPRKDVQDTVSLSLRMPSSKVISV